MGNLLFDVSELHLVLVTLPVEAVCVKIGSIESTESIDSIEAMETIESIDLWSL